MFLDESAFDMDDGIPSGPPMGHQGNNDLSINLMEDDMEDLTLSGGGTLNSAGGLGTSSASRARMLAQQRELQLKKRQSTTSSGMVRSSMDKTENSSNFSVRQFSAPKAKATAFDDDDAGDLQPSSTRSRTSRSRFARDRDDDDLEFSTRSPGRNSRDNWGAYNDRDREKSNRERDDSRDRDRYRERNSRDREDSRDRDRDRGSRDRGSRRDLRSREDSRDRDDRRSGRRSRSPDYRMRERDSRDRRDRDDSRDRGGRRDNDRERDRERRGAGRSNGRDYPDEDDYYRRGGRWGGGRDDSRDRGGRDRDDSRDRGGRDRDDSRDRGGHRDRGRDRDWDRDRDRDKDRNGDRSRDRRRGNDDYGSEDRGDKWSSAADGDRSMPVGASSKFRNDKAKEQGNKLSNPNRPMPVSDMDLSDMERFLTSPLPRGKGVVQCYIIRNKSGTNKLFPVYSLYLKEGDRFLMCSKKRPNNKTSNYLISRAEGDLNKDSVNCLGKLRSNFVGTEFQVFDNGVNPNGDSYGQGRTRCEMAVVTYAPNVLGSRGPRKMQVAIPAVDDVENTILASEQSKTGEEDMLQRMKDRNLKNLCYFINKPPRWNEQVGAYVLNFSGRVTMASVKNFQLVDPDEQNAIILQFGRVDKDQFTMDMQYPLSPFQAFAITMSSFDSKIACD